MNVLTRLRTAPVTVEEAKLNIFAPLQKIGKKQEYMMNKEIYDDDKYKVKISGIPLTQIHRDILDLALFFGDCKLEEETSENIPVRTFSLYSILEQMGHKEKRNQGWLTDRFKELKRATITLIDKRSKETYEFNIIRASKHSHNLNTFVLVLEELYLVFFEKKISIDYKYLVKKIVNLDHAQTKAVVRYLLTFSQGHQINIDNLLRKVGVRGSQRNLEIIRKKVIEELKEKGYFFNIKIIKTTADKRRKSDTTIKYSRHEDVKIYYPKVNEKI